MRIHSPVFYYFVSCLLCPRWRRAKEEEDGNSKKHVKRPYLATECDNLRDAERWRQQVGSRFYPQVPVPVGLSHICVQNQSLENAGALGKEINFGVCIRSLYFVARALAKTVLKTNKYC